MNRSIACASWARNVLGACAATFVAMFSTQAAAVDKMTVAGLSKPISEITNLLAEPDKGFFKAEGIELGYVPGTGGGSAIRNMLTGKADLTFTDPTGEITCGQGPAMSGLPSPDTVLRVPVFPGTNTLAGIDCLTR